MRVLVTGVAGFIGSSIAKKLLEMDFDVTGIDSFTDYYDIKIKKRNIERLAHKSFKLVERNLIDITDYSFLGNIDYVFHHAAQPGVRASWGTTFETYVRNNITATQVLLEALKSSGIKKFVYASSSSVYGNKPGIMTEETLTTPHSPYGATKLAAEHLCGIYNKNHGLPTVCLRYFTVYGPRQRPDMAFTRFIVSALTNRPITVYGDGSQTRDFTYIEDVVNATIHSAKHGESGSIINIGGGHIVSVNDVLKILRKVCDHDLKVSYEAKQKGDVDHTKADISKAKKSIGYRPTVTIDEGLKNQYEYIKENLSLYAA